MSLKIKMEYNAGRVLRHLALVNRRLPGELGRAMRRVGAIGVRDMKHKLSGESHTLFPGTANPYPGVIEGRLRGSVHSEPIGSGNTVGVIIGPNTDYASAVNDKYQYVRPTWKSIKRQVTALLRRAVRGALS